MWIGLKIVIPLFTNEIEKTLDFYLKIGFEIVGDNKLRFAGIGADINVYQSFNELTNEIVGKQSAELFFISMQIKDMEGYKQLLKSNGIKIEEIQSPPIGEYLYIRDPNGNRICIYENYR